MSNIKVLDLFSGCGGLSKGFESAGFNIEAAIDFDSAALKTLQNNHKMTKVFCEDLGKIDVKSFVKNSGITNVDVIIGGPPCQGFSISGKRDINDPRNGLYKSFFNFVYELKPKVFLMENVPNILSMDNGAYKEQILSLFESIGYAVTFKTLIASEYGIPQNRKRVIFIGFRGKKIKFEFPKPTHGENLIPYVTTKDAISDLPENGLIDGSPYLLNAFSDYQIKARKFSTGIFNHQITNHTDDTIKIISMVPDGGNYKDLPNKYRSVRKVNIAWTRYSSIKPSLTIDTGHRHHFHYEWNRVPTVRESARLQSFLDDFIFYGSKTIQYKHVGNAVPPLLSKILAKSIYEQLI